MYGVLSTGLIMELMPTDLAHFVESYEKTHPEHLSEATVGQIVVQLRDAISVRRVREAAMTESRLTVPVAVHPPDLGSYSS